MKLFKKLICTFDMFKIDDHQFLSENSLFLQIAFQKEVKQISTFSTKSNPLHF